MKKHPARSIGGFALAALALLMLFASCSRQSGKVASGVALDRGAVVLTLLQEGVSPLGIQLSSSAYAEVNESAIPALVEEFRADLSKKGIPVSDISGRTGYDARFQCTAFADFFAGSTAARMMGELWHSPLNVNRPTIFVVWYVQDNAPRDADGNPIGHAINLMIVNGRRCVWIEPQTGRRLALSAAEKLTARVRA
jgi:hypothetical protein